MLSFQAVYGYIKSFYGTLSINLIEGLMGGLVYGNVMYWVNIKCT